MSHRYFCPNLIDLPLHGALEEYIDDFLCNGYEPDPCVFDPSLQELINYWSQKPLISLGSGRAGSDRNDPDEQFEFDFENPKAPKRPPLDAGSVTSFEALAILLHRVQTMDCSTISHGSAAVEVQEDCYEYA